MNCKRLPTSVHRRAKRYSLATPDAEHREALLRALSLICFAMLSIEVLKARKRKLKRSSYGSRTHRVSIGQSWDWMLNTLLVQICIKLTEVKHFSRPCKPPPACEHSHNYLGCAILHPIQKVWPHSQSLRAKFLASQHLTCSHFSFFRSHTNFY